MCTVGVRAMTSKAGCVQWAMGSCQQFTDHSSVIAIIPLGKVSHSYFMSLSHPQELGETGTMFSFIDE